MAKKKITTEKEFLARLKKEAKDGWDKWVIQSGGEIRLQDSSVCPITFVHGEGLDAGAVEEAARDLGMSEKLQERIVEASDYPDKAHTKLRARILQAVGLLSLLLYLASPLQAQTVTEPVITWDLEFWAAGVVPGVGAPLNGVQSFTRASALCDMPQVVVPIGNVLNPTQISLADPDLPGRDCILNSVQASGVLASIPLGTGITATARARGATLISARSAASNPFNRAIVVVAPTTPSRVVVRP